MDTFRDAWRDGRRHAIRNRTNSRDTWHRLVGADLPRPGATSGRSGSGRGCVRPGVSHSETRRWRTSGDAPQLELWRALHRAGWAGDPMHSLILRLTRGLVHRHAGMHRKSGWKALACLKAWRRNRGQRATVPVSCRGIEHRGGLPMAYSEVDQRRRFGSGRTRREPWIRDWTVGSGFVPVEAEPVAEAKKSQLVQG